MIDVSSMHPDRLKRGALLGVYAPMTEGGEQIATARLRWEDGSLIEAESLTREGHDHLCWQIQEWRDRHGYTGDAR